MKIALHRWQSLAATVAFAVLLHALLLLPLPLIVQTVAALLLVGWLPGMLLIEWLLDRRAVSLDRWARHLYAIATGYSVMTLVMLAISYLPGGVAAWQIYAVVDSMLLILVVLIFTSANSVPDQHHAPALPSNSPASKASAPWIVTGVLLLLLVGGGLRLTNLGYAEFQGDEGRAVQRAAAVIQGYEDVLFLHRKGPVEILLPTLVYTLTGHLTEATARLPFALANLVGLVAVFVLGWRLLNPVAGWVAAMLLALDGYFIGFARIVQYQSVVILMSVLVVLILHRLAQRPVELRRYLILAALFLATGMLAHYEAVLVVVPGLCLLWQLWQRHKPREFISGLIGACAVGGAILAAFFVPFVLHPSFRNTVAYLADERIGGSLPYNHLADFFLRTTLYDTTYAVLLLIGLATLALLRVYWQALASAWRWLLIAVTLAGLGLTFANPTWLTIGTTDLTFVFFLALFVSAWFALARNPADDRAVERTLWLWFGSLVLLALFFVAKPRTHVYVFFLPWVLIVGMISARGWLALRQRWGVSLAGVAGGLVALAAILLFGSYAAWYFVYNGVEIYRTWDLNRPAGFWTVYEQPDDRSLFGFPLHNGWKTVGVLYAEGLLDGPYESNDVDDWVADWYTRGADRCLRDHKYFMLVDSLERKSQADKAERLAALQQTAHLWGTVLVNQQPRLQIFQLGGVAPTPQIFDDAVYAKRFDNVLSTPYFPLDTPVVEPPMAYPLHLRFGDTIWLEGYALERTAVQPGELLTLTLYWRTTARIDEKYTVFNQVFGIDNRLVGQLASQPGCDALPTDDWPVGELIADHYRVPIAGDATPGDYRLVIGMINGDGGARLAVDDATGAAKRDSIELTTVQIGAGP